MQAANLSLNGEGENMSKKAAGILLLAVGVGAAVMYSRKAQAQAPYYLNPDNGLTFKKSPVNSAVGDQNGYWAAGWQDMFAPYFSDGMTDYMRQIMGSGDSAIDPDRIVPYDTQKTTSGVSESFFDRAGDYLSSAGGVVAGVVKQPSGIRKNNPLNLTRGVAWAGKRSTYKEQSMFEEFRNPWFGIRAGAMDIKNSYLRNGNNTITRLVKDHSETDHAAYIAAVSKKMGLGADTPFNVTARLSEVVKHFIQFENGQCPYSDDLIVSACNAAITLSDACPAQWQGEWVASAMSAILPSFANYA